MNRPNRTANGIALMLLTAGAIYAGASYALVRHPYVARLPTEFAALKTCELHGEKMQLGTARILYGWRSPVVDIPVSRRHFPRAYTSILGGCTEPGPDQSEVKFCPRCRAAEVKWMVAHHVSIPKN